MAQDTPPVQAALEGRQWCARCEQYKDLDDFQPSRRGRRGAWCRECSNPPKQPPLPPVVVTAPTGQLWCCRCERYKDLDAFQPSRREKKSPWCRACCNIEQRERRGKTYETDPDQPKTSAVIAECSTEGCTYVGVLLRDMCRNHYAAWQKLNTNVSWFTENGGLMCGRCRLDKPLSEFYKDKNTKSGYRARCKPCCRLDQKESYERRLGGVR